MTATIVVMIVLFAFGAAALRHMQGRDLIGPGSAIDGDSLRLYDRELRLQGIDAPEYRQTCRNASSQEIQCGRDARRTLADMLARANVRCALKGQDRFGRDLATCHAGEVNINAAMVRAGMAIAFGAYESEEANARAAKRGLWALQFDRPAEWRARHPRSDRP
ncbi:MAG: thermonuclease family protein [Beijerinckiaceae bacterium]